MQSISVNKCEKCMYVQADARKRNGKTEKSKTAEAAKGQSLRNEQHNSSSTMLVLLNASNFAGFAVAALVIFVAKRPHFPHKGQTRARQSACLCLPQRKHNPTYVHSIHTASSANYSSQRIGSLLRSMQRHKRNANGAKHTRTRTRTQNINASINVLG